MLTKILLVMIKGERKIIITTTIIIKSMTFYINEYTNNLDNLHTICVIFLVKWVEIQHKLLKVIIIYSFLYSRCFFVNI